LKIVNNITGYFYYGNIFAVTINAGDTWMFFDVAKDSDFGRSFPNKTWISDTKIENTGKGIMRLSYENQVEFVTEDFGQTWIEKKIGG
jgi:hypothetical protein